MKLINGDRCSGKIIILIKYVYENNVFILCYLCGNLNYIIEKVKELKLDIIILRVFKIYIEFNYKIEYMKIINGNIINDIFNIRLVIDEIDCCLEFIIREGIDCVIGII